MRTSRPLWSGFGKLLLLCLAAFSVQAEEPRALRSGWSLWDPYQFEIRESGVTELTGLDVQLLPGILRSAGYTVDYKELDWKTLQDQIRSGERDVVMGAYRTPEREEYAMFSEPYRVETDVLVLRRGMGAAHPFTSVPGMLREFTASKFRLGVVPGNYYGPEVAAWLARPENAPLIHEATSDNANLSQLLKGRIDGFLADRLVAATVAWRSKTLDRIEPHPVVVYSADVHAMFSRKTCSLETVEAFNAGLRQVKASGEYNRIARRYGLPVLLGITVHRPWFVILDMVGVVAFAISGVLIARRERYDIFGAFVLAILPAAGGGILRDLLSDRSPIGILRSPACVVAVLATVAAGFLFYRISDALRARGRGLPEPPSARRRLPENIYLLFDAVGLAAFTVIGVVVAVEQQCEPLWLWGPLFAAMTGAGGGIMRDMLRADSHNPSLKGAFYPEVALIWGLIFALFLDWESTRLNLREVAGAVIIVLAGTLVTRLVALRYGLQSPFLCDWRSASPASRVAEIDRQQIHWLDELRQILESRQHPITESGRESLNQAGRTRAAEIADLLTSLSTERLTDTLKLRFLHLLQRQPRLLEIQNGMFTFLDADQRLRTDLDRDTILEPLAASLDVWMKTLAEVLENPSDTASRTLLAKILDGRKKVLERCQTLAGESPGSQERNRDFFSASAAFERMADTLSAVLAAEARIEQEV